MDKIFLKDLVVKTLIGVDDDERRQPQEVIVNVTLDIDLSHPAASDSLDNTLDYRDIAINIREECATTEFYLVETLAEMIAGMCLEEKGVEKVTVSVEKVAAMEFVGRVGVEITRGK